MLAADVRVGKEPKRAHEPHTLEGFLSTIRPPYPDGFPDRFPSSPPAPIRMCQAFRVGTNPHTNRGLTMERSGGAHRPGCPRHGPQTKGPRRSMFTPREGFRAAAGPGPATSGRPHWAYDAPFPN